MILLFNYIFCISVYTSRVTHLATQGMKDPSNVVNGSDITSWVKEYSLEYSSDGETYNGYYFNKDLKVYKRCSYFDIVVAMGRYSN